MCESVKMSMHINKVRSEITVSHISVWHLAFSSFLVLVKKVYEISVCDFPVLMKTLGILPKTDKCCSHVNVFNEL